MYEIFEDVNGILDEIKDSRNRKSYLEYLSHGGQLTEMEFEQVLGYSPTESEVNNVTTKFPHMLYEDKLLVAKIYNVISGKKICMLTDTEVYCEYLAFTNRLKSFYEARLAEEKEKRKK